MTMKRCFTVLAVSLLLLAGHASDTLTVTFTGDILLDRGVRERIRLAGIDRLFTPSVDSLLRKSDLVVGNLECPATKIQSPVCKRFVFRAEPKWLPALRQHGFTHLDLANNHSIDQGREGLMDTKRQVEVAGMVPVGAGKDMEEASQPVLLAAKPRKVWLLCSLRLPLENFPYLPDKPCVSQEGIDTLALRVAHLRQADPSCCIFVLLHWGWEHHLHALPGQTKTARRLIEAGADALIGHHSHTLQTVSAYQGRPVYYGIGNFIFDQRHPINTRAAVVKCVITAQSLHTELLPIDIKDCAPSLK